MTELRREKKDNDILMTINVHLTKLSANNGKSFFSLGTLMNMTGQQKKVSLKNVF